MAFTGNYTCNVFKTGLLNGTASFSTGVFKIALYNNTATLDANTAAYTSEGEVAASGYSAGGSVLTPTVNADNGTSYVSFSNVSWAVAVTARGALIYKESGPAVCVLDFGSDKTSTSQFEVQFPANTATSAIIRIS